MGKYALYLIYVSICLNFLLSNLTNLTKDKNKLTLIQGENKSKGFYYRTTDKQNTILQPDPNASALRVSKEEIGRFTWTLLHSMAAAYPKEPTPEDKLQLQNFINAIPTLYPCKDCGGHFGKMLSEFPIKDGSRAEVIEYFCFLHNQVNVILNKAVFDCSKAAGYWGGDCGCSKGAN